MLLFPNCKINLGLRIVSKRPDGFHNLETVFYPIPFTDALEVIQSGTAQPEISYSSSGNKIDGNEEDNLCIKAYRLLKKDFPDLPALKLHLHKAIPTGAGLGGGSSDAAFMLKLLNEKFQLNLSTNQLINYSLQLGSDCPFFILNKSCFATGRGELMEEINLDLSAYKIVLVNPGIHVPTGWAFSQIIPAAPAKSAKEIIRQPVNTWKNELVNDFEKPVFEKYPEIKSIKEELYQQGAVYAGMSGSGSTVFGIFQNGIKFQFNFPEKYLVRT